MSNLEKALQKAISARNKTKSEIVKSEEQESFSDTGLANSNGYIPDMYEDELKSKQELEKRKIIYPAMLNGKVVDQFREIRTHIYQALRNKNTPVLVTAVSSDAGNTFVTKNIAAAIALDDAKTSLIVDCNLINPGFEDLIESDRQMGVTDYIEGRVSLEEIIKPVGIKRMRLVAAGAKKESVTDYLTSTRLKALFKELMERYSDRVILVDSPSINDSADAKILADLFSYVVLVVPYRKVTEGQIAKAIKAIGKDKIIGIVINREPRFLSLFQN
jgi:capsular exopolysaccharide synthesis family protein